MINTRSTRERISPHFPGIFMVSRQVDRFMELSQLSGFLGRNLPWRYLFWGSLLFSTLIPAIAWWYVQRHSKDFIYTNITHIPHHRVAIVFGAAVWADGSPTPMLADRIEGAVDLYHAGRIDKILMTGDNSSEYYNEVVVMQSYAMQLGVPEKDITLDYAGFSTYDSCYRAKEIFGVDQAILVTQQFHIARAVYTCRQLDLAAIGLGTPDWQKYGGAAMRPVVFREVLADVKALLELHLLKPEPVFLGKFEGIR